MGDTAKKILFVNSQMYPYLPESTMANICRELPQGIQERHKEIRAFMPLYGCINGRKNQLHEVIRLSGMNIIIAEVDRPLVIKVASISAARIQVYFIDNEDYFRRKQIYRDDHGKFFADNGERAIFFARGVLDAVKKQRWAPDIIHCTGWISHLLPFYLKKAYKDDPIFSSAKVVLSLFDDTPSETFSPDFIDAIPFGPIKAGDVELQNPVSGIELAKLAAKWSDGIILASPDVNKELVGYSQESGLPLIPYEARSYADGTYMDRYNAFYDDLLK